MEAAGDADAPAAKSGQMTSLLQLLPLIISRQPLNKLKIDLELAKLIWTRYNSYNGRTHGEDITEIFITCERAGIVTPSTDNSMDTYYCLLVRSSEEEDGGGPEGEEGRSRKRKREKKNDGKGKNLNVAWWSKIQNERQKIVMVG